MYIYEVLQDENCCKVMMCSMKELMRGVFELGDAWYGVTVIGDST